MILKILKNQNPRLLTKSKNRPTPLNSILGKGRVLTLKLGFGFFNSLCSYWICSNQLLFNASLAKEKKQKKCNKCLSTPRTHPCETPPSHQFKIKMYNLPLTSKICKDQSTELGKGTFTIKLTIKLVTNAYLHGFLVIN